MLTVEQIDAVKYEDVKDITSKEYFLGDDYPSSVFDTKYAQKWDSEGNLLSTVTDSVARIETPADVFLRVASGLASVEPTDTLRDKYTKDWFALLWLGWFRPGGSVLSGIGKSIKQSTLNCTTIPLKGDSLEDIAKCDYDIMKCAAFRQGLGVDASSLRPKNAKVNNAAEESTGVVPWVEKLVDNGKYVGQAGRVPAILISLKDRHPDIFEFITSKVEQGKLENANISVQISNAFMEAVKADGSWELYFDFENNVKYKRISKTIKAKELFDLIATTSFNCAEPGVQYIDKLREGYMVHQIYNETKDERFKGISTNACCFTEDTIVQTNKGPLSFKEIKNLMDQKINLKALSRDFEKDAWRFMPIVNFFENNAGALTTVVKVTFEDGTFLYCTPDHKIYTTDNILMEAGSLTEGTLVITTCSYDSTKIYLKVKSVKQMVDKVPTYNIEVEKFHNYVVNDVLVKNSEKFLAPYNVCNLLSPNHEMFSTDPTEYKKELDLIVPYMVRMSDNVVSYELEKGLSPLKEQAWILDQTREIGLGITNIHGWLLKQDLAYDSDDAIDKLEAFFKHYACTVFKASIQLGEEKGSAPGFDLVQDKSIFMHSSYFRNLVNTLFKGDFNKVTHLRNLAHMSIAPTGSLSSTFPLACFSYGVEPVIAAYYWRRTRALDKGIYVHYFMIPKKVQDYVLGKLDPSSEEYKVLKAFPGSALDEDGRIGIKLSSIINNTLPEGFFKPAHFIDPLQKIKLMSKLYNWVDAAISCTYNLPKTATLEDVKQIYIKAYDTGVRAVSIYVDGSREGILIFEDPKTNKAKFEKKGKKNICINGDRPKEIVHMCAPKRPLSLLCNIHHCMVKGDPWIVLVGMFDELNPYEVFAGKADELYIPKTCKRGSIHKLKDGHYALTIKIRNSEVEYKNVAQTLMTKEQQALTRLISLAIRHGCPLEFLISQLKKVNCDITDFSTVIARVLGSYVTTYSFTNTKSKTCPVCGENSLILSEGCVKCVTKGCSYTRCE